MNYELTTNDHCPECNPRNHSVESSFSFAGELDEVANEALYACDDCGALVWITTERIYV